MEITVTEGLRLKNELSTIIKNLTYKTYSASFGVTLEDNEITSKDADLFNDVEIILIKALNYSEELNNKLGSFNKETGVDAIVRKMQNAKLLLSIYTGSLPKTKPSKQKKFENLGTVRKSVEIVFKPSVSSTEIKSKISAQKEIVRKLQTEIEKFNQNVIEISFEYKDVEELTY